MAEDTSTPQGNTEGAVDQVADTQNTPEGAAPVEPNNAAVAEGSDTATEGVVADQSVDTPDAIGAGVDTNIETQGEEQQQVPESYADFTVPEGVEINPKALEAFAPLAKEMGLSQENAQKFIDIQTAQAQEQAEAQSKAFDDMANQWAEEVRNDPEFGGEKLKSSLAIANATLSKYGSPELTKTLTDMGLNNHPEMVRLLYKFGKAVGEDTMVHGNKPGNPAEGGKTFYDKSPGLN